MNTKSFATLTTLVTIAFLALSGPAHAGVGIADLGLIVHPDCDENCIDCENRAKNTCGIWGVKSFSCSEKTCTCTFTCGPLGALEVEW